MGHRHACEGALAPALRRLDGVRLVVGEHGTRAEVYGIGYRRPVTISVSVGSAARLVEAGVPLTVRVETSVDADRAVLA